MIDQHFTSVELARTMIDAVPASFGPQLIADFAAGEGGLLDPAIARWPAATVVANDWSKRCARHLEKKYENGIVSCANFLSTHSVSSSKLRNLRKSIDLIVLNPPFSQRGVAPLEVAFGGEYLRCSAAFAFLRNALDFLTPTGMLIAVLPDGCLASERDSQAWAEVERDFCVDVIRDNSRSAFLKVAARTSIVRIRPRDAAVRTTAEVKKSAKIQTSHLVRGRYQMHSVVQHSNMAGDVLIHTTDLKAGEVGNSGVRVSGFTPIRGPALLFPRVGRVTSDKISLLERGRTVALSDCVIGFPLKSERQGVLLRATIIKNWADFASQYRGTGAPFITLAKAATVLQAMLKQAGIATHKPQIAAQSVTSQSDGANEHEHGAGSNGTPRAQPITLPR